VLAIANTLADRFGISVSVENPHWVFPADSEDVALADPAFSAEHRDVHHSVMKNHRVKNTTFGCPNLTTIDIAGLRQVADAANKEMPYGYRLVQLGDHFVLVPTTTRNAAGRVEQVTPLMNRHVTIPQGTRTVAEPAKLVADELSRQTGLNVSCCQAFVAGVCLGRLADCFRSVRRARA
jgi:hypothetical protein